MTHSKTRSFNYLSFLWLILIVTSVSGQTTRHVDVNASLPTHDGIAWCSAFLDLQLALDVAIDGDTIRVADGTYLPDTTGLVNSQEATFQIISGVTIEGGYEGCGVIDPDFRNIVTNPTILSGDLDQNDSTGPAAPGTSNCCTNNPGPGCDDPACEQIVCEVRPECCVDAVWNVLCFLEALNLCCNACGDNTSLCDNSYHVVTVNELVDTVTFDGVIIEKGNAVSGTSNQRNGGGLYSPGGHLVINDSTIRNNTSTQLGGGIYIGGL